MGIHWYILSAIVVIVIQRFLFRRFGMKRLTYERSFSVRRCFEGDHIEMIERLTNGKILPVPWLRVESLLHTGLKFQSDANFDVSNGQFYQNHKSLFSLKRESAVDQEACRSMYAKRLLSINERFPYVW